MRLALERPLIMLDLETTGLDITKDRIIQIGMVKTMPDGTELDYKALVNPEMPIPADSTEIHGISDTDVKDAPIFADLADELADFIGDGDLAGYNSNKFDIPVLAEAFLRAGHVFSLKNRNCIDVQNIFHKMEQRTLAAAYQFYCNQTMENAHDALVDTKVTLDVFKAQLERYSDLPVDVSGLAEFSRQSTNEVADFAGRLSRLKTGELCYNFGKHKGKTIVAVDNEEPGYFGWMMNADFPLYTKLVLKEEMELIKLNRKASAPADKQEKKPVATESKPVKRYEKPAPEDNLSIEEKLKALQNKFNPK